MVYERRREGKRQRGHELPGSLIEKRGGSGILF